VCSCRNFELLPLSESMLIFRSRYLQFLFIRFSPATSVLFFNYMYTVIVDVANRFGFLCCVSSLTIRLNRTIVDGYDAQYNNMATWENPARNFIGDIAIRAIPSVDTSVTVALYFWISTQQFSSSRNCGSAVINQSMCRAGFLHRLWRIPNAMAFMDSTPYMPLIMEVILSYKF